MSWESTTCGKCYRTQDFYGRIVPPCPQCGYPELKTAAEYYVAMGVITEDCNMNKETSANLTKGTLAQLKEQLRLTPIKRRLKVAFRRKPRPAKLKDTE